MDKFKLIRGDVDGFTYGAIYADSKSLRVFMGSETTGQLDAADDREGPDYDDTCLSDWCTHDDFNLSAESWVEVERVEIYHGLEHGTLATLSTAEQVTAIALYHGWQEFGVLDGSSSWRMSRAEYDQWIKDNVA